ncbi:MAG: putative peptide modification system cyclase, partial [Stenotrophomonas sp.]
VAELLLVVAVGAVAWVLIRPEPAIAFAERDWVVVGDFSNQTGNLVLDDALQQALRISLEQSRHVNVVSDLKVRETLRQMRKDPAQPLDRATAKEVAIRDGARAVVMPSVQEINGKLRVSMDVVDPATGRVVYSEYADGSGLDSALNSLDKVAAAIRLRLGEASDALSQASLPLPQVATSNLDALHVYAAAQLAYGQADAQKSLDYYEVATRLDPKFAMAYLGQMRSLVSLARLDEARSRFSLAEGLRDRLSARQALYMDAWKSELYGGNEVATFRAWKMLADLYPDHHAASANLALAALSLGRYSEAERAMERVNVPQVEFPSAALLLHGRVQLVQGKQEEAVVSLREAMVLAEGRGNRYLVGALAAGGQFKQARDVLLKLPQGNPGGWLEGTSLALDETQFSKALAGVDAAAMQCGDDTAECDVLAVVRIASHAAAGSCVSAAQIRTVLKPLLDKAAMPQQLDRGPRLYYAAALIYSAQRMGLADAFEVERRALERVALDVRDPRATELIA